MLSVVVSDFLADTKPLEAAVQYPEKLYHILDILK